MSKPIEPWDAVKFFSNPGKYVPIQKDGMESVAIPVMNMDGTIKYPANWQGMREKPVKHRKWIILFSNGSILYASREECKLLDQGKTIETNGEVRLIEWET